MQENTIEQRREALMHKTFLLMFRVLVIFGVPAAIGYFVGKKIDTVFDVRPKGTLAALGVTFIFSWFLTIRLYLNIQRQFQKLREDEEKLRAQKQVEIQATLHDNQNDQSA